MSAASAAPNPSQVRIILLVSLLTLAIWVVAERQSLRTAEVPIDVVLQPGSESRAVWFEDGTTDQRVRVRFEGSTAALDRLPDLLRSALPLTSGVELPDAPGEHTITLREVLRTAGPLRDLGVSIASTDPALTTVRVDELVTRTLRVRVETPRAELESPPETDPPTVVATMPSLLAERLGEDASAVARLEADQLEDLSPGRRGTLPGVPLTMPSDLAGERFVSVQPTRVDVSMTLRSRTRELVLPRVPVMVAMAPVEVNGWEVRIPPESRQILDVRVSGPDELIAQVERGEIPVFAWVALSFEELERGITSKRAVFSPLPGRLKLEAERMQIPLAIRRAEDGGPEP